MTIYNWFGLNHTEIQLDLESNATSEGFGLEFQIPILIRLDSELHISGLHPTHCNCPTWIPLLDSTVLGFASAQIWKDSLFDDNL